MDGQTLVCPAESPFPTMTAHVLPSLWPHLRAMDLAIIILPADAQDLACLQPAHQVGLAVLLHQWWGLLRRHGAGPAPPALGCQGAQGGCRKRLRCHMKFHDVWGK